MGEAKARRAAAQGTSRSWAIGSIKVVANDVACFTWSGTKREAVDLQKRYLDTTNAAGISAESYAKRAAGYLMVYGMPQVGALDRRPSNLGNPWSAGDVATYKAAVLWLALPQHIPNTGRKLEDVFVDKALVAMFSGDKAKILDETMRELRGEPFDEREQFTLIVGVLKENYRLDPRDAISMPIDDLLQLARGHGSGRSDLVYLPRIPIDATEADGMLKMMTILADACDPTKPPRTFAGYTHEELSGGRPSVIVR